jgi:hypothetical protein
VIEGNSDPAHISASYVERKFDARIQKTLRVTPAMTAGVSDRICDVKCIVGVLEKWERQQEYRITS